MRLLVIEDEPDLAEGLVRGLRQQGYAVDVAYDGLQGWELAITNEYDLLILDLNLPEMDGLEVCRRVRASRPALLILMLTARSGPDERVAGLDLGADDYLVKPFHFAELVARIRALLRRDMRARTPLLQYRDLKLDPLARVAWRGNRRLELTGKEFSILEYLMRHLGEVVSQELADTFDAMLERLGQTFELQNRFVADVAHELRTPLASLRTNLEVVTADKDAPLDDYRTMVATQERALSRLERLVADLLILAKSEQPLVRSEVAIAPLLEEVLCDLKQQADARQVTLRLIDGAEVMVPGNGQLLARAFSNLVENGIYYNRPAGEVVVTIDQKDEQAVVTIADTGIGVDADKQAHIFERFYRVDCSRARHKGGAGLGLSIVAAIVQQHGGQVQVGSVPDRGSIFTVVLPL